MGCSSYNIKELTNAKNNEILARRKELEEIENKQREEIEKNLNEMKYMEEEKIKLELEEIREKGKKSIQKEFEEIRKIEEEKTKTSLKEFYQKIQKEIEEMSKIKTEKIEKELEEERIKGKKSLKKELEEMKKIENEKIKKELERMRKDEEIKIKKEFEEKKEKLKSELEKNLNEKKCENESLLSKIKSDYILEKITDFIPFRNYILQIFIHSKKFQKLLNIDIKEYQEKYLLQSFPISTDKYLNIIFSYPYPNQRDYNGLKKIFLNDLSKYNSDAKLFESIILLNVRNNIKNYKKNNLKEPLLYLSLNCPILESLSKTDSIKYYCFQISDDYLKNSMLTQDLIDNFTVLNKEDSKYPIIEFMNVSEKYNLKELNINFDKIKNLRVWNMNYILRQFNNILPSPNSINEILSFFSPKNILERLYLSAINTKFSPLDKINDFKSLKSLDLNSITFAEKFTLKLNNLKSYPFAIAKI